MANVSANETPLNRSQVDQFNGFIILRNINNPKDMRTIQDGERRFRNIFKVFYADFTCGECGAQFNCQHGEFIYNKDYIESGHKYIYLVCPYCHKYHHNYTYNLEPTPSVGWVVRSKVVNFHHEINISAWDELTGGQ